MNTKTDILPGCVNHEFNLVNTRLMTLSSNPPINVPFVTTTLLPIILSHYHPRSDLPDTMPLLSELPPEMSIKIFEGLDSFRDIAALESTSRNFHDIWRSNSSAIWKAVRPRAIPCLKDAEELLKVERHRVVTACGNPRQVMDDYEKALVLNAKKVSQAYEECCTKQNYEFRESQKIFTLTYYQVCVMVALEDALEIEISELL